MRRSDAPTRTLALPPDVYNASGAFVSPLDSADDWVLSHHASVGHFDGEGECTFTLDP